jgi:hypothetical protein
MVCDSAPSINSAVDAQGTPDIHFSMRLPGVTYMEPITGNYPIRFKLWPGAMICHKKIAMRRPPSGKYDQLYAAK